MNANTEIRVDPRASELVTYEMLLAARELLEQRYGVDLIPYDARFTVFVPVDKGAEKILALIVETPFGTEAYAIQEEGKS